MNKKTVIFVAVLPGRTGHRSNLQWRRCSAVAGRCVLALLAAGSFIKPAQAASTSAEERDRLLSQIEPRIKAIYEKNAFATRPFNAMWLPDGSGYLTLEAPAAAAVQEIASYEAASGKRTVVVPGEKLRGPGADQPLKIRDFVRSPSGNRFLLHTDSASGKQGSDLWLYELESGTFRPVDVGAGVRFDVKAFSPDGQRLLGSRGDDLIVFDIAGGRAISLTQDGKPDTIKNELACWSPDGQWIAFVRTDDSA